MDNAHYKQRLEEELKTLETELSSLGVQDKEAVDWVERTDDMDTVSADPNDVADRTEEYDTRRAELSVLEGRWNDVKRALQKIETGNFGVCEVGGEPIEADRLEANPAARTCKVHMDEALPN